MSSIQLPFAALRAFEQFARTGSVAGAAQELSISTSAVVHQLNALNAYAGRPLTQRNGRELALTQEGRNYFEAISPAFTVIRQATSQLGGALLPRRILVSALPLIANAWLAHELDGFARRYPQIDLQLQYARYRNYSSDSADISLRYGTGDWPGYSSTLLLGGEAVPVASRRFAEEHGLLTAGDDLAKTLQSVPLIHDGGAQLWERWFIAAGQSFSRAGRGLFCEDGLMTLNTTLAGMGVSLARPQVVWREIASGRLVRLSPLSVTENQDYYICSRDDQTSSTNISKVVAYLLSAARRQLAVPPTGLGSVPPRR